MILLRFTKAKTSCPFQTEQSNVRHRVRSLEFLEIYFFVKNCVKLKENLLKIGKNICLFSVSKTFN